MDKRVGFPQFLRITGNEDLLHLLEGIQEIAPIDREAAARLANLVRLHMATGSIESVVDTWIRTHDFAKTDAVLDAYIERLITTSATALHVDISECGNLWKRLPAQMARENTRFHNYRPKDEANGTSLEPLIIHLVQEGVLHRIRRIDRPQHPAASFVYQSQYKYYFSDTGLFRRSAGFPAISVDRESPSLSRFRGVLSESYVLASLAESSGDPIWYWKSGHQAEVDFEILLDGEILPVEVKTARNVKSHSLALYRQRYGPRIAIRVSLLNLKRDDELINVPLYMVDNLASLVTAR